MKSLAYLLSGVALLACSLTPNSSGTSAHSANSVPSKSNLLKSVALQAREEMRLPPGSQPHPNRPISFATVLLNFENPVTQEQTLRIEKVEVVDRLTQRSLLVSSTPQLLTLRPLEHAMIDIQLQSPKAYGALGQVQAIVTYSIGSHHGQVDGQPQEMRSEAIAIERY